MKIKLIDLPELVGKIYKLYSDSVPTISDEGLHKMISFDIDGLKIAEISREFKSMVTLYFELPKHSIPFVITFTNLKINTSKYDTAIMYGDNYIQIENTGRLTEFIAEQLNNGNNELLVPNIGALEHYYLGKTSY